MVWVIDMAHVHVWTSTHVSCWLICRLYSWLRKHDMSFIEYSIQIHASVHVSVVSIYPSTSNAYLFAILVPVPVAHTALPFLWDGSFARVGAWNRRLPRVHCYLGCFTMFENLKTIKTTTDQRSTELSVRLENSSRRDLWFYTTNAFWEVLRSRVPK